MLFFMLGWIKKIPFIEALISFLGQLGLIKYVTAGFAMMWGVLWSVWGYLESNLPYWAIGLIATAAFGLMLFLINQGIDTYQKIKSERIDTSKLALELIEISDGMARAVNDYIRDRDRLRTATPVPGSGRQHWERTVQEGSMLTSHISEKYGARLMAATILMSKLQITIPFHLSHMSEHTVMGLASFLGAVGHLLKSGNISDARGLTDETGWTLSHLVK